MTRADAWFDLRPLTLVRVDGWLVRRSGAVRSLRMVLGPGDLDWLQELHDAMLETHPRAYTLSTPREGLYEREHLPVLIESIGSINVPVDSKVYVDLTFLVWTPPSPCKPPGPESGHAYCTTV